MPVTINEVVVTVDPGPTEAAPQQSPSPATSTLVANTAQLVRAQVALIARRAARLHAD